MSLPLEAGAAQVKVTERSSASVAAKLVASTASGAFGRVVVVVVGAAVVVVVVVVSVVGAAVVVVVVVVGAVVVVVVGAAVVVVGVAPVVGVPVVGASVWPDQLAPQQTTVLSRRIPHEWKPPTETCLNSPVGASVWS